MQQPPISDSDSGYLYIGARAFGWLKPGRPESADAMTVEKGERIASHIGANLLLKFIGMRGERGSGLYFEYANLVATLADVKRPSIDRNAFKKSMLSSCDAIYIFKFTAKDIDSLRLLYDRRDLIHDNIQAMQQFAIHWGTQAWGGLEIEIHNENTRLFRCMVDIFSPMDDTVLNGDIFICFYSMDPTTYENVTDDVTASSSTKSGQSDLGKVGPLSLELLDKFFEASAKKGSLTSYIQFTNAAGGTFVGNCMHCSEKIYIDEAITQMNAALGGGFALLLCFHCNNTLTIRILSDAESARRGTKFEIVIG